ncbi:MAG TPA: RNA-binding domain-containing protein [Candidatus Bathyarchaeia archaeon]|nr:RNA-binding domain-containing protein [Candidatus Bathyarchaeia archaeon]
MERIVQSVEISTIIHATEDPEKVQAALDTVFPPTLRKLFTRRYLEGHHGNPIITINAKLSKAADIKQFTQHFLPKLSRDERLKILRDLILLTDAEGNLFIRVDKQSAFQGLMQLTEHDPIRVKIKFSRLSGKTEVLVKKFLEPEDSD